MQKWADAEAKCPGTEGGGNDAGTTTTLGICLEVGGANPADCTPDHACSVHAAEHTHGPDCGHEAVPHGDHVDYLVDWHLHHTHGDHCDNHGQLATA